MSTLEWFRGAQLPALQLWWWDCNGSLIDFSTATTYEARIGMAGCPALKVKTSGMSGAAGSGAEGSGVPNLTVQWAAGDLDVEPGTYTLTLIVTVGGLQRYGATTIKVLPVVAPLAP